MPYKEFEKDCVFYMIMKAVWALVAMITFVPIDKVVKELFSSATLYSLNMLQHILAITSALLWMHFEKKFKKHIDLFCILAYIVIAIQWIGCAIWRNAVTYFLFDFVVQAAMFSMIQNGFVTIKAFIFEKSWRSSFDRLDTITSHVSSIIGCIVGMLLKDVNIHFWIHVYCLISIISILARHVIWFRRRDIIIG